MRCYRFNKSVWSTRVPVSSGTLNTNDIVAFDASELWLVRVQMSPTERKRERKGERERERERENSLYRRNRIKIKFCFSIHPSLCKTQRWMHSGPLSDCRVPPCGNPQRFRMQTYERTGRACRTKEKRRKRERERERERERKEKSTRYKRRPEITPDYGSDESAHKFGATRRTHARSLSSPLSLPSLPSFVFPSVSASDAT